MTDHTITEPTHEEWEGMKEQWREQQVRNRGPIAVKWNNVGCNGICPLCGGRTDPDTNIAVFVNADSWTDICVECTRERCPLILTLLEHYQRLEGWGWDGDKDWTMGFLSTRPKNPDNKKLVCTADDLEPLIALVVDLAFHVGGIVVLNKTPQAGLLSTVPAGPNQEGAP